MSHLAFSSGQLPGVAGGTANAGGTGSALLPNITAELRGEFYPLLSTLASCKNDISTTYVMELFFTLVRFDAVLKEKERQLLVSTAQQLITRLLQQLQKVCHMRQLLDENERFVGELIERCSALECLCGARDGDDDSRTNDGEGTDDIVASGQALSRLQLEDNVVHRHGDGGETVRFMATTRAAGATAARRRPSSSAVYPSNTIGSQEPRRFSFDDGMDDITSRASTVQQSRQQQQHRAGLGGNVRSTSTATTEGGGATTPLSPPSSLCRRSLRLPPPLQQQSSSLRTTSRRSHTRHTHSAAATPRAQGTVTSPEQVASKTSDEDGGRVVTALENVAGTAAATDITPAVYSGVQHALQEHFRNNVRHTLTGSMLAVSSSPSELVQQPHQPLLRGVITPSSRSSERPETADGGVAEVDMDSAQQQPSLAMYPSLASSPGLVQRPFSSFCISNLPNSQSSAFLAATVPLATSSSNALGIEAGGALGLRMDNSLSAWCAPIAQEPVDTAKVWNRMFWRFLDGLTATGDLAVLLTLLDTGNPAQTEGAATLTAATNGISAVYKGSFGSNRSGPNAKRITANNAAAATDDAGGCRASLASSLGSAKCGVQPLIDALNRSGSYSQLLPAANASQALKSTIAAVTGTVGVAAGVADEALRGSIATKGEQMMDDGVEQQQQQHARRTPLSSKAQSPVPAGVLPSSDSRMNNTSFPMPLNLDDFVREEELRLHRDFWTHIPAILATLTEGVMYDGSHESAHPHKRNDSAPYGAGSSGEEVTSLQEIHSNSDYWDSVPRHGTTNESGRGDEEPQDLASSAGVTAAAVEDEANDNILAALHLPSSEALQLLPIFSPLLRNYTGAVGQLMRSAPKYARSTQAQHACALAVVAAAAAQQQYQQAVLSSNPNDATASVGECPLEGGEDAGLAATVSTSSINVPLSNVRAGLTGTAAQESSVTHIQGLKDSQASPSGGDRRPGGGGAEAAAAAAGCGLNVNNPAPAEAVERGLLAAGSCTEVRAVDIVVYALVTALYVQCSMAVAMQQQERVHATAGATIDGKTSLSDGGRTPAGMLSPQGNWPFAGTSSGSSFAADVGLGTASGNNNASMFAEEDRVPVKGVPNVSLSNPDVGDASWRWSGGVGSGGGYSLNTSIGLPPNTLFHPHLYLLHPMALRTGSGGVGRAMGYVSNGSFHERQSYYLPQSHAHLQQQRQSPQLLRNFSFSTTYSPTDAALLVLRIAHERKSNGNGSGEGEGRPDSVGSDEPVVASAGLQPSLSPQAPCINLSSIEFTTQDIVACANSFSHVSLPSIMKMELQHLQEELRDTSHAVQRMEGQARGELALLLFRLLSIVLNWLMPAVYVADPRVWLFYRKWSCDLYRVLCTDVALLEEFRRLLNQSSVAVSSTTAEVSGLQRRRGGSTRDAHRASQPKACSATSTPNISAPRDPLPSSGSGAAQSPPQTWSHSPGIPAGVSTVAADSGDYHDASTGYAAPEGAAGFTGGVVRYPSDSFSSPLADDALAATSASIEDAFSFILPGSSLAVSVSHETPPVQPGVLNMLAQEEVDRRGEAPADMASLRAAQALLSDEGTVVPLPCPFLITRLVAATLRGIDADIAESLLWVVGQAPVCDGAAGANTGSSVEDDAGGVPVDAHRSSNISGGTSGSGLVHNVEVDEGKLAVSGRHLGHAAHRTTSGHRLHAHYRNHCVRHHRSISADACVGGSTASATMGHYMVDSEEEDDDGGYGDHWYGVLERRKRDPMSPAPLQNHIISKNTKSRAASVTAIASPTLPHAIPQTPFIEPVTIGGPQPLFLPHQPPEGPTLMHHHRFRYPSVHGYDDVAGLYLSTLNDAELFLSPHDPVYASLVLSAADLHLHDLHDTATAASLVNAYLVDVGEEHIQGPVWGELPAAVTRTEGGGGAASSLNAAGDRPGSSSSARSAPGRGFSVTHALQGKTHKPTSPTRAPSVAPAVSSQSTPAPPPQQLPYVPMVIPSWNNEQEKEEFLATLLLLRQMQAFLSAAEMKTQTDVLES
nr:unnamed protein product [Leishmania braziliensis]